MSIITINNFRVRRVVSCIGNLQFLVVYDEAFHCLFMIIGVCTGLCFLFCGCLGLCFKYITVYLHKIEALENEI